MYTVLEEVADDVIQCRDKFGVRIGFFEDDDREVRCLEHAQQMEDLDIGHMVERICNQERINVVCVQNFLKNIISSDNILRKVCLGRKEMLYVVPNDLVSIRFLQMRRKKSISCADFEEGAAFVYDGMSFEEAESLFLFSLAEGHGGEGELKNPFPPDKGGLWGVLKKVKRIYNKTPSHSPLTGGGPFYLVMMRD